VFDEARLAEGRVVPSELDDGRLATSPALRMGPAATGPPGDHGADLDPGVVFHTLVAGEEGAVLDHQHRVRVDGELGEEVLHRSAAGHFHLSIRIPQPNLHA